MNVLFGSTWLASGGYFAADKVRINGVQVTDDATYFRAFAQTVFARGNVKTTLKFVTHWVFNSVAAAELFALTLPANVPTGSQQACQVTCSDGVTQVYLNPAVIDDVQILEMVGCSVDVEYALSGGVFTSTTPPDFPTAPGSATLDGQPIVYARGNQAIASGLSQVAVSFGFTFSSIPIVTPTLVAPTGEAVISGQLISTSMTGFVYQLAAPTPDGNYGLNWLAIQ